MKINYSFIRAIFALVVGLILVCAPDDSAKYIVMTIGILFLVPGIVVIIGYYASNNKIVSAEEVNEKATSFRRRFPIEGIGSILLGFWFIISPLFFANLLMIVLSVVLIAGGLQQIVMLFIARKWKRIFIGYFVVPVIVFGTGIYVLFNPNQTRGIIFIIIGVACLVYAVTELFNWFMFIRHKPVINDFRKNIR